MTTTTATTPSNNPMNNTRQMIAQNYDQFLTLLTAQLKNQNPLDPLDTNQFTSQMVQFASVQQQMKQNDTLTTLVANTNAANAIGTLNFVGKTVTAAGKTTSLSKGSATWVINAQSAGSAKITVSDKNGNTVYTTTKALSAGTQNFNWDGSGPFGITEPDGAYTITVNLRAVDGSAIPISTEISGKVDGVDLSQSPPSLTMGPVNISLDTITSIQSGS